LTEILRAYHFAGASHVNAAATIQYYYVDEAAVGFNRLNHRLLYTNRGNRRSQTR
jgi:hypothetical protein